MKPEHEQVIEAMVNAILDSLCRNDATMALAVKDAIRAAGKRGYRLAKLPERAEWPAGSSRDGYLKTGGWNDCLDSTETIEMEEIE